MWSVDTKPVNYLVNTPENRRNSNRVLHFFDVIPITNRCLLMVVSSLGTNYGIIHGASQKSGSYDRTRGGSRTDRDLTATCR